MTRIIAGEAGSLGLLVPKTSTRPTSDRVREAMFSALESRLDFDGTRVLDLYAGSGALGLEAISRGATHATLVDSHPEVCRVLRANAKKVSTALAREVSIDVRCQPVNRALVALATAEPWDLVFLDPPYELDDSTLLAELEALAPLLQPDALVVVERSAHGSSPTWPEGYGVAGEKTYGDTRVVTLSR